MATGLGSGPMLTSLFTGMTWSAVATSYHSSKSRSLQRTAARTLYLNSKSSELERAMDGHEASRIVESIFKKQSVLFTRLVGETQAMGRVHTAEELLTRLVPVD